jgi:hypothetical protein
VLGTIPQTALTLARQLAILRAASNVINDIGVKGSMYSHLTVMTFQKLWNRVQPDLAAAGMRSIQLAEDGIWGPVTAHCVAAVLPDTATSLPSTASQVPTWWRAVKTTLTGAVSALDAQLAQAISSNIPSTGDTSTQEEIARTLDQAMNTSAATIDDARTAVTQSDGPNATPGETFVIGGQVPVARPSPWPWVLGILGVGTALGVLTWAATRKRRRRVAA